MITMLEKFQEALRDGYRAQEADACFRVFRVPALTNVKGEEMYVVCIKPEDESLIPVYAQAVIDTFADEIEHQNAA